MSILRQLPTSTLLDVGCNEGLIALNAPAIGHFVVAIDGDPEVVGALFDKTRSGTNRVLSLAVDICEATPGAGWGNSEHESFLSRTVGRFDVVIALAVVHHIAIHSGALISAILTTILSMSVSDVLLEWIDHNYPVMQHLANAHNHLDGTCSDSTVIKAAQRLGFNCMLRKPPIATRTILWLRKSTSG